MQRYCFLCQAPRKSITRCFTISFHPILSENLMDFSAEVLIRHINEGQTPSARIHTVVYKNKEDEPLGSSSFVCMCPERESNPYGHHWPRDFKSLVSTNSTIWAIAAAKLRLFLLSAKKKPEIMSI